ncbi:SIR2 family protein [Novosphingobium sp. YAF33]|uniref:SIR2 family protein n=1 Tax=Novosphingobium sp. YAF33 TaxID=3233082 RepID=UPI003F9E3E90
MSDPAEVLKEILDRHPAAPFLFVGSGFSRRYLGTEAWAGLLERFCAPIKAFGYYSSRANGDLSQAASYMALDYNEWWWNAPEMEASRQESEKIVRSDSDALKVEISNYIGNFSLDDGRSSENGDELATLASAAVDGIITTNWDFLLEELFPDFKVFVGQSELLFSNPQAIGEIYKIHGSAGDPNSLVLTSEDYAEFTSKNPYLAAKLVTIFVEHPIIFIGYSITDPHIRAIITSIAQCLTQDKIAAFQENLIFVQRVSDGEVPSVEKATLQSDTFSVTMTVAKIADFQELYGTLTTARRKIPARVLRFFKEQLYELVHTPDEIEKKLAVVDYEEIGSADEVEFVVGVGVAKRQKEFGAKVEEALAKKGYAGITANELFSDCLADKTRFDPAHLLATAFPVFARSNRTFTPIFRYLSLAGISSNEDLNDSKLEGAKKVVQKLRSASYTLPAYRARFDKGFAGLSTAEIIEKCSVSEAVLMLPFQPAEEVDLDVLREFLVENAEADGNEFFKNNCRKMVCCYDQLKYGF